MSSNVVIPPVSEITAADIARYQQMLAQGSLSEADIAKIRSLVAGAQVSGDLAALLDRIVSSGVRVDHVAGAWSFPTDPSSPGINFDVDGPNWDDAFRQALIQLQTQSGNINVYQGIMELLSNAAASGVPIPDEFNRAQPTMLQLLVMSKYYQSGQGDAKAYLAQALANLSPLQGKSAWLDSLLAEARNLSRIDPSTGQSYIQTYFNANSMNGDGVLPTVMINEGRLVVGPGGIEYEDYLMYQMAGMTNYINKESFNGLYQSMLNEQLEKIKKGGEVELIILLLLLANVTDDNQIKLSGIGNTSNKIARIVEKVKSMMADFSSGTFTYNTAYSFMTQINILQKVVESPMFDSIRGQVNAVASFFNNQHVPASIDPNQPLLSSLWSNNNGPNLQKMYQGMNALFNPTGANGTANPNYQAAVQNLDQLSQSASSQSSATLTLTQSLQTATNSENAALNGTFKNYQDWCSNLARAVRNA
jgi:hypothetical protein